MFNKIVKDISVVRRKAAEESLLAFGRTYLPEHLKYEPSDAHKEIYEKIFSAIKERGKKIAIAAPRGFGKSTLVTLIAVLFCICYEKEKYIVIISATEDQSKKILENVKVELSENQKLRDDFPEAFERNGRPKSPRWTQSEIITLNKIKVVAVSAGQKTRGLKFGRFRPSLVIADDVETAENTKTPEIREDQWDWYNKVILKNGDEQTNYIILGTLYHHQSLLSRFIDPDNQHSWSKMKYKAIRSDSTNAELWEKCTNVANNRESYKGKQGVEMARSFYRAHKKAMLEGVELLWPQRWDYFDLVMMREDDPISFSSEYQNEPIDPKTQIFNKEELHFWNEDYKSSDDLLRSLYGNVQFYGACDPSPGKDTVKGDYSAIIIIAVDVKTGSKYVIEADIQRRSMDKIIADILAYARKYRFKSFGVEANHFQALILKNMEEESLRRGIRLPLEDIVNTTDKVQRIQSLQPFTKNGTIKFNKKHNLLIEQLIYFPKERYDDGPDALEMVFNLAHQPRKRLVTYWDDDKEGPVTIYNE